MNPHRASFSRHPLAQLAIALSAGICAASYFSTRLSLMFIAGAVCSATSLLALLKHRLSIAALALLLATAFAGATLALHERRTEQRSGFKQLLDNNTIHTGAPLTLTGVLGGPPEFATDRFYLVIRVERILLNGSETNVSGVVSLLAPFQMNADLQLRYGARIRVTTTLTRPDTYRNPGVSPLSEYLDRKGYDAAGVIRNSASITRLDDAHVFPPLAWLYSWREKLQREIDSRFSPETAGVLDAALLGNRYNLSRATSEPFREGGTFHVLVISGLHISFIGGIVFLAAQRLTRRRTLQFIAPAGVVWAYSFAVGAEASVVRAALMFTFAGLALVIFRQSTSLNALGGAALLLLVRSPKELFDPSFQLTFASVLAIVVIAWPLLQTCAAIGSWYPTRETPYPPACSRALRWFCEILFWSERKWKTEMARAAYRYRLFKPQLAAVLERYRIQLCLRYIFGAVVVSGAVQLVLLPMMIGYFHRLSPASLILNVVVSVLLGILTAVALLALVVAQFSVVLSAPLFALANAIDRVMVHSIDPFAHLGLSSVRLPEYSGWGALVYVVYYLPLLALVIALSRWRPLALHVTPRSKWLAPAALAQLSLLAILILHPLSAGLADGKLHVDFLDVGQGDAALITMPDGRTLLVDGGGRPQFRATGSQMESRSVGEAVVSEYLWWLGLDTVDYVLATHADADHIDGLNDVVHNFPVQAALVARTPADDPEYAKFSETLIATTTPVATLQAGDVIRFGDVEVWVLWPPAATLPNEPSRNNDSIVLYVKFGQRSVLLTGDIEKGAESALLRAAEQLRADVLKVPHHGSRSSSTPAFVQGAKPSFAIISVGLDSMFGHPHREVVERWQASGAQVLTTGECGTISVTTDGTDLTVKSQKGTRSTKH